MTLLERMQSGRAPRTNNDLDQYPAPLVPLARTAAAQPTARVVDSTTVAD